MPPLILYAAGSLRGCLTAMIARFEAQTGVAVTPHYGPSGKWRERIAQGDVPDVFASASAAHTEALARQGILQDSTVFAENALGLLAAPGIELEPQRLLDLLLDPALRLGTSTPGADPAGDYTWALFRRAEVLRPGAFEQLDRKALKLMGQPRPADGRPFSLGALLGTDREADLFIIYCSEAADEARQTPGLSWAPFPAALAVPSFYGIGAATGAGPQAQAFVRYACSPEGRQLLRQHGFR